MIAHVGEVERRPGRQIDEVGDVAGADAVDQVADRAAGQQAAATHIPGRAGLRENR